MSYPSPVQETLSIKVSRAEKNRLRKLASERGVSLSKLLKEGMQAVISGSPDSAGPSCYDLVAQCFEQDGQLGASGRPDHSTNKKYLADFGRRKN